MSRNQHRYVIEPYGDYRVEGPILARYFRAVCDCGWVSDSHEREVNARAIAQQHRGPAPAGPRSVPVPAAVATGTQLSLFSI